MQKQLSDLQNEALAAATEHIRAQRKHNENSRMIAICLTCLLIVAIICATVLGCTAINAQQETIREQLYSINMQYTALSDLLYGAEITTEYAETGEGDNGTAIVGDGNYWYGGDYNGESSQNNN